MLFYFIGQTMLLTLWWTVKKTGGKWLMFPIWIVKVTKEPDHWTQKHNGTCTCRCRINVEASFLSLDLGTIEGGEIITE